MTTTDDRPTFPTELGPEDVPSRCPAWCFGHDVESENDPDHPFTSRAEYEEARALFRRHLTSVIAGHLMPTHVLDLTSGAGCSDLAPRPIRPASGGWDLGLRQDEIEGAGLWTEEVVDVVFQSHTHTSDLTLSLTAAEALLLADHLKFAARALTYGRVPA